MTRPNLGKLVASKSKPKKPVTPSNALKPATTRFAPSPTGFIHLGSLRTASYNYLLAKATGGKFILRLEDTDRTRLKPGAEQNIYDSLKWTNILWDEGPIKQSERKVKYAKEAEKLLENGSAYRCFCSKERLDHLASTARQLWPPSTASYDRKCSHIPREESDKRAAAGESFVSRFKSPEKWPKFHDVLHGDVEISTQINESDRRYDDFVLLKSDKMPTYHFANVVDDADMKITHVVRGEEWSPSTPKHVALYAASGMGDMQVPKFVHIPLLTGAGGKKLSKRKNDHGIFEFAHAPEYILPEALVNFAALSGWSPLSVNDESTKVHLGESVSEVMSMKELEKRFSSQGLTKGNVQVDYGKLAYLNKQHFHRLLETDFKDSAARCRAAMNNELSEDEAEFALLTSKSHVSSIGDFVKYIETVRKVPQYPDSSITKAKKMNALEVVNAAIAEIKNANAAEWDPKIIIDKSTEQFAKKTANMSLRYALLDGTPGVSIVETSVLLRKAASLERLETFVEKMNQN